MNRLASVNDILGDKEKYEAQGRKITEIRSFNWHEKVNQDPEDEQYAEIE